MPSIAERLRRKIANMEDRIYAKSAMLQSKILTKRVSYKDQQGVPQMNKKSSWIRSYAWDSRTSTLYMTTHRGKTYSWANIPFEIAEQVKAGLGVACTTNDPTGQNRWFVGKTPSLGAAFWQILKPLARTSVTTPPVMSHLLNPKDYLMIGDWVEPTVGRPTKEMDRYNRFDRLKKGPGLLKKPKVGGTP